MWVDALYVYPLKSAAGIRLAEAELDRRGIRWDRRWMVVDPEGKFVTQREEPRLSRVRTALEAEGLVLSWSDGSRVMVPYEPAGGSRLTARVWKDDVEAMRLPEPSAWLSSRLGSELSVVFMAEEAERTHRGRTIGFADAYPLLVLGRASFDDLAARVEDPLVIERFRPNLVIGGGAPYAEDAMPGLRAGEVHLELVKPCARCTITTVDPATAERSKEPLRTLATYRTVGHEVMFGMNAVHDAPGIIRQGDPVVPSR